MLTETMNSETVFTGLKDNPMFAVLVFLAFFLATLVVEIIKKIYYYFKSKKRYYVFPRPSVQGIANIAMTIALSVAVLMILTFVTSNLFSVLFRAFPGSRITIEGILIKIGGLLYGPFIGMFIGGLTDLFSILLTAGVFHYGYFIAGIAYGLLAGIIKSIYSLVKENRLGFAIISTKILIICLAVASIFVWIVNQGGITQTIIPFLPNDIATEVVLYIFFGLAAFILVLIWLLFFFSNKYQKWKMNYGNKKHFKISRPKKVDKNYFNNFCLILICCLLTEVWINVLLMPSIDADVSTLSYDNWLVIRVAIFIPMIIFNFIIIFPVYIIVSPLVQWDYRKEVLEDLKVPFYIK